MWENLSDVKKTWDISIFLYYVGLFLSYMGDINPMIFGFEIHNQ